MYEVIDVGGGASLACLCLCEHSCSKPARHMGMVIWSSACHDHRSKDTKHCMEAS